LKKRWKSRKRRKIEFETSDLTYKKGMVLGNVWLKKKGEKWKALWKKKIDLWISIFQV